jgi:hypothetical protein
MLGLGRFMRFLILYTVGTFPLDEGSARRKPSIYTQDNLSVYIYKWMCVCMCVVRVYVFVYVPV